MKAYKAFNHDWTCRGFQYEIGKTYVHSGPVELCDSGFHACEAPLDVLRYYPPTANFAEVELDGVSAAHEADSKRAAKVITVKAALTLAGLISAQVEWVSRHADGKNAVSGYGSTAASSGYGSTAASSGNYSTVASSGYGSTAASSGYGSTAASSGNYSTVASSGDYSTVASSGDYSTVASSGYGSTAASSGYGSTVASSGDYSKAASSGDRSTAASSGYGSTAASSGNRSTAASSGDYSTAAVSGDRSTAASSGYGSTAASSGERTLAMVAGLHGKAKAGHLGAFALPWLDGEQIRIAVGIIGENGIQADTWYCVGEAGKLIETKE